MLPFKNVLCVIGFVGLIILNSSQVKAASTCKKTPLGVDYHGVLSQTLSGRGCQHWASQEPHKHKVFTNLPEGSEDAAKNYCRNPDNEPEGPWCYTTDPKVRWEYCDVKPCDECKKTRRGAEYSGVLAQTINGHTCQNWASQEPHKHPKFTKLPEGCEKAAKNFCRNPNNNANGPWCYTTDPKVRWEYCDVKPCVGCKKSKLGTEYAGSISQTISGLTCQSWSSQAPHKHPVFTDLPDGSQELAKNYCRNHYKNPAGPWCYTTDPSKRWEYCDVKFCECKTTKLGTEYGGTLSHTVNNRTCQDWTSRVPHKHPKFTKFPEGSEAAAKNYCRNPNNTPNGPFCYTTDPKVRWEYCDVKLC
jgi:integrin beta 3